MLRVCEDGKLQAQEGSRLDPAEGAEAGDFDLAVLDETVFVVFEFGDEVGLENRKILA